MQSDAQKALTLLSKAWLKALPGYKYVSFFSDHLWRNIVRISLKNLKVKIFADGAEKSKIEELASLSHIQGFTTNPTLMKQAGIADYQAFAKEILPIVAGRSISFEVFSDELDEMERQAERIATWGDNIYVKIPVTNTKKVKTLPLIRSLSKKGVKLNVTAVFTKCTNVLMSLIASNVQHF
jgi:transaldolase